MAAPSTHVLGIDPKMYRHFAALTVVISLSIAFIANGDQKRGLDSKAPGKFEKQDSKKHGARSESDVLNGASQDSSSANMSAPPPPPPPPTIEEGPFDPAITDDGQLKPMTNQFSYRRPTSRPDPAMLAKMTPEQRAAYLKALALRDQQAQLNGAGAGGGGPEGSGGSAYTGPTQQQVNRLVSASRARSGGGD